MMECRLTSTIKLKLIFTFRLRIALKLHYWYDLPFAHFDFQIRKMPTTKLMKSPSMQSNAVLMLARLLAVGRTQTYIRMFVFVHSF